MSTYSLSRTLGRKQNFNLKINAKLIHNALRLSIFFTGPIQQKEFVTVPAPVPPPRAYDSLLPKLFLSGGPTWATGDGNKTTNRNPDFSAHTNQEIWKEEKEEDEDLTESGQQKGEVPVRVNSNDHQGLLADVSSSGSGWDIGKDGVKHSAGNEGDHHLTGEQTTSTSFSFPGSGDKSEVERNEVKMIAEKEMLNDDNFEQSSSTEYQSSSRAVAAPKEEQKMEGKQKVPEGDGIEETSTPSGSGEEEQTRKHVTVVDRPKNGLDTESIKIVLPENDFSGSGKIIDKEGWADSGVSLSGSGQHDNSELFRHPQGI